MRRYKVSPTLLFEVGLVSIAVTLVLLPISPANRHFISRDSGVFLYMGWRILNGEIPYVDVWDHKPPVIFFIDALGLALGNGSVWGVLALEFVSLFCAAYIGFRLAKKLFGSQSALIALYLWMFSLYTLIAGGNLTQEYALPLQFASLLIFEKAERDGNYLWRGFLIGLLTGIAFFIRQNAIGIGLSIATYVVIERLLSGQKKRLFTDLLSILAGGLTVVLIVVSYFAAHQALREFLDAAFIFNFIYVGERGLGDRVAAVSAGMGYLSKTALSQFSLVGWALSLIWLKYKKSAAMASLVPFVRMMAINLPIEIMLVSLGGRPRVPYFITLLPTLTIFAGLTFWAMFKQIKQDAPRYIVWIFTSFIVLSFATTNFQEYIELVKLNRQAAGENDVVSYIQQNTSENDYVLLIGAETAVNFLARRRSPTRYVYQYPLYRVGYAGAEKLEEFYKDIIEKGPRLIIVTIGDGGIPNRFGANKTPQSEAMANYIQSLYVEKDTLGSWVVYEYVGE